MQSRTEKATELFKSGYNCSQAVFLAYSDLYGLDNETALRIASSFGGGMGRLREVCGAVSGMFLVAGMETGTTDCNDREGKKHNYEVVQQLAEEFRKANGSIICRELLGLEKAQPTPAEPELRTAEYYKKRPCAELVEMAAEVLEKTLLKDKLD